MTAADLFSCLILLYVGARSQSFCIWGSHTIANGFWTESGTYDGYPRYIKSIDASCTGDSTLYFYYAPGQWRVAAAPGSISVYAYCATSHGSSPLVCTKGKWSVSSGGSYVADPDMYLSTEACPEWSCNSITIPSYPTVSCQGPFTPVSSNVYVDGNDVYFYYNKLYGKWICSVSSAEQCGFSYYANSLSYEWTAMIPGYYDSINFQYSASPTGDPASFQVNCRDSSGNAANPAANITPSPTAAATEPPTAETASPSQPTTANPTGVPTKNPSAPPTASSGNSPTENPVSGTVPTTTTSTSTTSSSTNPNVTPSTTTSSTRTGTVSETTPTTTTTSTSTTTTTSGPKNLNDAVFGQSNSALIIVVTVLVIVVVCAVCGCICVVYLMKSGKKQKASNDPYNMNTSDNLSVRSVSMASSNSPRAAPNSISSPYRQSEVEMKAEQVDDLKMNPLNYTNAPAHGSKSNDRNEKNQNRFSAYRTMGHATGPSVQDGNDESTTDQRRRESNSEQLYGQRNRNESNSEQIYGIHQTRHDDDGQFVVVANIGYNQHNMTAGGEGLAEGEESKSESDSDSQPQQGNTTQGPATNAGWKNNGW